VSSRLMPLALALSLAIRVAAATAPAAGAAAPGDAPRPDVTALLEKAKAAAAELKSDYDRRDTYVVLAHAQAAAGDKAAARASLLAAREALAGEDHPDTNRVSSCCEIADELVKVDDRAEAAATLQRASRIAAGIRHSYVRADAYREVAPRRARLGDDDGATADFDAAVRAAEEDPSRRDGRFKWIARSMANAGRFAAADALAERIADKSDRWMAYEEVAAARARAGDMAGARKVVDRLPDDEKCDGRWAIVRSLYSARKFDDALAVAAEMRDCSEREIAYAGIVKGQAEAGDVAGAGATAALVQWGYHKEDVFSALALAQARAGDATGAKASAALALQGLAARNDPFWRDHAQVHTAVGRALALAGDTAGAKANFAEARSAADKGETDDRYHGSYKWEALAALASAQAEAGDPDAARATLAAIEHAEYVEDDDYRAKACQGIAAAEAPRGDLPALHKWIDTLKDPLSRAYAFAGAAEALAQKASARPVNPSP